ncbi:hypothetical protein Ciccas_012598, partial [Cichlidogyrus casuarinus]
MRFREKLDQLAVQGLLDVQSEQVQNAMVNQAEDEWAKLSTKLDQYQQIAAAEVTANQIIFDCSDTEAWMLEKELSLVTYKEPT